MHWFEISHLELVSQYYPSPPPFFLFFIVVVVVVVNVLINLCIYLFLFIGIQLSVKVWNGYLLPIPLFSLVFSQHHSPMYVIISCVTYKYIGKTVAYISFARLMLGLRSRIIGVIVFCLVFSVKHVLPK